MPRVSCYYIYTIVSLTFIFMLLYSIWREKSFSLYSSSATSIFKVPSLGMFASSSLLVVAVVVLAVVVVGTSSVATVFFTNCPRTLGRASANRFLLAYRTFFSNFRSLRFLRNRAMAKALLSAHVEATLVLLTTALVLLETMLFDFTSVADACNIG